ncbi:uncharacterized protein G2W53_012888 [Senna tora]|uniref:Uncharacterized protein n=1 Tax=Senna tora TaxID=362788 RepID=A0A834WNY8_9FABA|nr:uncharacterized protein G2W53_012888 [Senna tora]
MAFKHLRLPKTVIKGTTEVLE